MDAAALQQLVGEKRTRADAPPASAAAGTLAKPAPIADLAINASVLNATSATVGALGAVLAFPATEGAAMVTSDADEQLLITITLPSVHKLHAITVAGPSDGSAPATVKLFANKSSMAFEDCEDFAPTQTVTVTGAGATTPLNLTKFSAVSSLSVFVESNQGDTDATSLTRLELIGLPVHTTNMNDLKKGG